MKHNYEFAAYIVEPFNCQTVNNIKNNSQTLD